MSATAGERARSALAPAPWQVVDLGITGYREAWARQLALVEARKGGAGDDTLLLVEHPHVITLGRRRESQGNVVAAGDVEVVEIERGGDVTYHGPGQLVAYPIVLLRDGGERDLHAFLRGLEDAVIATLAAFDLPSGREPGKTGVWLDARAGGRKKICSMGIACRRWVTFHGLALNVTTDLSYFHRINPCGFASEVMTSMAEELGVGLAMADVRAVLARELGTVLGRRAVEA
ncbi:MAG: lipoyl(octanoyl) transferase LipB [Kofleriaceae bacterium]